MACPFSLLSSKNIIISSPIIVQFVLFPANMATRRIGEYSIDLDAPLLGSGSQGYVRKAVNTKTNKMVAAKEIPCDADIMKDEYYRKHIEPELECWKTLEHPNLVNYLYSEIKSGYLYLIFEFCQHGSLNRFVRQHTLTPSLKQRFIQELADVLNYLHSHNILHRDLKPDNLLVQEEKSGFHIRLCDLGTVKEMQDAAKSVTASFQGTLMWAAPEVHYAVGRSSTRYSAAVDTFSAGLVFHAILNHNSNERLQPLMGNIFNHIYHCISYRHIHLYSYQLVF